MTTLTIEIADRDQALFEQLVKRLNAKIIAIDPKVKKPNSKTLQAIDDASSGKTKDIKDLKAFFEAL